MKKLIGTILIRIAFSLIKFRAKHLVKNHSGVDVQFENEISRAFRRELKDSEPVSRFKNSAYRRFRSDSKEFEWFGPRVQ